MSAPDIVAQTGLSQSSVRDALIALEAANVLDALGSSRARLYGLSQRHPLSPALRQLFEQEAQRAEGLLDALRDIGRRHAAHVAAIYLFGSMARGSDRFGSDMDLAIVLRDGADCRLADIIRAELHDPQMRFAVTISPVIVGLRDIAQAAAAGERWWSELVRDAVPLAGPRPEALLRSIPARNPASLPA